MKEKKMKASELKKDIRSSLRISSFVKSELARQGLSIQAAFDKFIDENVFCGMVMKETAPKKKKK